MYTTQTHHSGQETGKEYTMDTNREVQTAEWSARIQECRESGMSISAWCRENGIVPKTYYVTLIYVYA